MEAAAETRVDRRKPSREMEAQSIENVKSKGTIATEVPREERARMREHLRDMTAGYTAEIGEEMVKDFDSAIQAVSLPERQPMPRVRAFVDPFADAFRTPPWL